MDFQQIAHIIALIVIPLLLGFSVHEFSHAWMALRMGDPTAKAMGRVTLNPIKHMELFGSVLMPLMLILSNLPVFAMGKPVPVNYRNFEDPKKGILFVSLAGPVSNFIFAIVCAIIYNIYAGYILSPVGPEAVMSSTDQAILSFLHYMIMINLVLGYFNMIPIPPLDGFKVVSVFLPHHIVKNMEKYTLVMFIFLMVIFYAVLPDGFIHMILNWSTMALKAAFSFIA